MSAARAVAVFFACAVISLAIVDFVTVVPMIASEWPTSGEWRQLFDGYTLINLVAAPIVTIGGLVGGLALIPLGRRNGLSRSKRWMIQWGAVAGLIYAALVSLLLSAGAYGASWFVGAGALAGACVGWIWCVLVEQQRNA